MSGALDGIKVLDLTSYIAGPFATMLLGDLGAEIIKIEQPGTGDMFRRWDKEPALYSPLFRSFNRNKKSVTLNLASVQGMKVFASLVETADVIVENFRPGVVDRLRVNFETMLAINPRIVYCSISAFGQTGPYRNNPGYDTIGQALSGLLSLLTDVRSPQGPGVPFSDHLGGLYGCYGILAALMARERTGRGQKVETSLVEATMSFIGYSITQYLDTGDVPNMVSRLHQAQVYAFVAQDGLPFVVHLSHPKKFWEGLTQTVGRLDLRDDPRFKDDIAREANYDTLRGILEQIMRQKPRDHWIDALQKNDVPCGPIMRVDELFGDPQIRHLDRFIRIEDPKLGASNFVKNGANLSATPAVIALRPPMLGEHTGEILGSLGYSEQDVEGLRASGVI